MNKKIKKLAEEAKFYADENHAHYVMNPHWINTFEEKFAELIVRECANWLKETDSNSDIGEDDAIALLNHFGVKE